jgi:hypothetical protein
VMTQASHSHVTKQPALILFGNDAKGQPHAAWFPPEEADAAERSSGAQGYAALRITTENERAFAAKLPRGRICKNTKAQVPLLSRQRAGLLKALVTPAETQEPSNGPQPPEMIAPSPATKLPVPAKHISPPVLIDVSATPAPTIPRCWEDIEPGSVVLAHDQKTEAWFETVVLNAINDVYRLRWRDYSGYPVITRQRHQLGLIHPRTPRASAA